MSPVESLVFFPFTFAIPFTDENLCRLFQPKIQPVHLIQSSGISPVIRSNAHILFVTSKESTSMTCQAITVSLGPVGVQPVAGLP